jgi:Thioesterase-like superfamily
MTETLVGSHPFTDLTVLDDLGAGGFGTAIDPMWTIGTKVHGGCMLAVCAAAADAAIGDTGLTPIALSASYLNAPDPAEVQLATAIRRRGRQVSLVDVELSQDDRTAVTCTVTLGHLDSKPPRHQEPASLTDMPAEPPADAIPVFSPGHPLGQIIHVGQGCHMLMDPATTGFLDGQQGAPITRMWVRPFADDEVHPTTATLFALMTADISPPVIMHRGFFGWTPTVQLTAYLRRRPAPGWLRVIASSTVIGDTWFEEDHLVIDATGQVVVQSRQLAMLPKVTWRPE